jgi:signal transduction histidine kinase
MQNLRIKEISRRLLEVQEQERHLLAAELHDDLGQSLTSLKLMLELSGKARTTASRQKRMAEAREMASELMNKVRNLSLDLRPAMLDDFGLFVALRWLFDLFQSRTGISVKCDHDLDSKQRFDPHVETAAFRIIQEALTNIARYASVKEAKVTLLSGKTLSIEIADKGTGFNVAQVTQNAAKSAGLSGMQERAHLLGGSVNIISKPGAGTRVIAEIPLRGVSR